MFRRAKTNGDRPSFKFNLEALKPVSATLLACIGLYFLYVEWKKPSSTLQQSGAAAPAQGAPIPFVQNEVHTMLQRGDVSALKKLLDDAGDQRTEWCLNTLETAITAQSETSLDFVLDGLEERVSQEGIQLRNRFEGILKRTSFMPPQVQADVLLHVKSFSSDPQKIATIEFGRRSIFEHQALRDALVKVCANNMPEELMRKLFFHCESPKDWQIACELLKDQDIRARSAVISQLRFSGDGIWKSNSLTSIFNLCDEQALNELADHCMTSNLYDPLEKALECGAKVSFKSGYISQLAGTHPKVWKAIVATLTQEDLEQLWWDGITSNAQLNELKLWEDKLKMVVDVPKRISNDYGVTALEHLLQNPERWETCEWLVQQKAKTPKSEQIITKLFLAVALNHRNQLKNLIESHSAKNVPGEIRRALMHSAIRMGHSETCGVLTEAFAKLGPNDAVLFAIERDQWACIQEMLNSGHELQSDEMREISKKAPGGIAGIMADVKREISPKSVSILIETAIDRNDEAGLEIAMGKARTLSDKARDGNGVASLQDLFGKDEAKRLVDLAISHPRSLAILQFQGFPIDFDHLLNSVRVADVQAAEVCLRSILMMNLSESDRRQLEEELDQTESTEIRELFEQFGRSTLQ